MFTSKRERNLWALAFLVTCTIFATLGIAQSLAHWLIDRDLIDATFGLGMFLVCGAILLLGIKARPSWLQVGIAAGIIAVYLIVFARMAIPEERSHLIEYSVLALLIFEALRERKASGQTVLSNPCVWPFGKTLWWSGGLAFLISSSIGVLDEVVQFFIPGRVFDVRDIVFNVLASAMAVGGVLVLTQIRQWQQSQ